MIQINVYSYPDKQFLGTRFAPMVKPNHELINNQVKEVRLLNNKKESEVFFQTTIIQ